MKILHTADWHLGKTLAGYSLLEDQAFILEELKKLIEQEDIDLLVVAGDVYDKGVPSTESVKLLDNFIYEVMAKTKTKVLLLAGNHDNATRLSFGNRLYQNQGLHIIGEFEPQLPRITLLDEFGPVNFFSLPYFSLEKVSAAMGVKFKTTNEAFLEIIQHNMPHIAQQERNVLIAHGFFSYLQKETNTLSDLDITEAELPVGGMDIIDISPAEFFDYVALGHIHSPQKIVKENIRYSGSLLKYSIAEAKHKKSVTVVELKEKGKTQIKSVALPVKRDLKVVEGFIDEIIKNPADVEADPDDYVFFKLKDTEVFDGMFRLRQTFGNALGLSVALNETLEPRQNANIGQTQNLLEMFGQFYLTLTGQELADDQLAILKDTIEELSR